MDVEDFVKFCCLLRKNKLDVALLFLRIPTQVLKNSNEDFGRLKDDCMSDCICKYIVSHL